MIRDLPLIKLRLMPNGGEAQPTSIWPDIACVSVTAAAASGDRPALTPKCLISASAVV